MFSIELALYNSHVGMCICLLDLTLETSPASLHCQIVQSRSSEFTHRDTLTQTHIQQGLQYTKLSVP